ncbi:MAG: hypothetical protein ACREK6_00845 [Candidatus Rokuibacteriota bacterium]
MTEDLDFGNVLRFPPEPTAGIVVLRPSARPTLAALNTLAGQRVRALAMEPVTGRLWVVEPGRIRVHQVPAEKE